MSVTTVWKALAAFVAAIGTEVGVALADGSVSSTEWLKALTAAVVVAAAVWAAPKNAVTARG